MAIWEWMLEAYAQPGVPEACLDLQDAHGQNTVLLLYAVYAETADPERLAAAAAAARAWDAAALTPLRAVRRALKAPIPPFHDSARLGLREEVKRLELTTERLLAETLEGAGPKGREARGGAHALDALTAASEAWGPPAPASALAALAAALA